MTSGLYKYIVFEPIERSTGKVYDEPCHRLLGAPVDLPVSDWVAAEPLVRAAVLPAGQRAGVKVLVTGGSGFIGSHVVDRLEAHGHEPRIFDLVPSPHHAPGDGRHRASATSATTTTCARAVAGCDAVLHLAAVADVDQVARDPALHRPRQRPRHAVAPRGRARARHRPLRLREHDLGLRRRVRARRSSTRTRRSVCRSTSTRPRRSRARCTRRATASCTASSTRSSASASPTARARGRRRSSPRSPPRRCAGQPLTIAGDGTQSRRFVYVEDLADGVVASLAPAGANRVFNLVGDEDVSVRAIARTVRDVVGDVPIVHVEGRAGDLRAAKISGERARRELGWEADDDVRRRRSALRRLGDRRRRTRRERRRRRGPTAAQRPSGARSPPSCRHPSRAAARRRPGRAARVARRAIDAGRRAALPVAAPGRPEQRLASRARARGRARPS